MLAGYLPFDDDPDNPEGDNINLLYKYIVSTPLTFPEYVTPHARDLLKRILVPDPRQRADLFEVARHSWLSDFAHVVSFITSNTTTSTDVQKASSVNRTSPGCFPPSRSLATDPEQKTHTTSNPPSREVLPFGNQEKHLIRWCRPYTEGSRPSESRSTNRLLTRPRRSVIRSVGRSRSNTWLPSRRRRVEKYPSRPHMRPPRPRAVPKNQGRPKCPRRTVTTPDRAGRLRTRHPHDLRQRNLKDPCRTMRRLVPLPSARRRGRRRVEPWARAHACRQEATRTASLRRRPWRRPTPKAVSLSPRANSTTYPHLRSTLGSVSRALVSRPFRSLRRSGCSPSRRNPRATSAPTRSVAPLAG